MASTDTRTGIEEYLDSLLDDIRGFLEIVEPDLDFDSLRKGVAFLHTDSRLSYEDMNHLIGEAILMYLNEEQQKNVEGENFEGRLHTNGGNELLGSYYGRRFDAELYVNGEKGKGRASFLVTEKIRAGMN